MTFQEINDLIVEDCEQVLTDRIMARGLAQEDIDEEILEIELQEYKDFLKRQELSIQVSNLVDNNCATIKAFPLSAPNYKQWLIDNVTENTNIEDAIDKLQDIQNAEVEIIEEKLNFESIRNLEQLGELSEKVCRRAINLVSGYFIASELTTEQIDTLKTQFSEINAYLFGNQPWAAKALISGLVTDDEIITDDIKNKLLTILTDTGLPGL